nr:immunoglobulin heavy chain junction region [Macaca mulatta]MOX91873.1 immunoglobulin heavy chain junction region [Macaca mulatta]MOX92038.1 immunoglobulin heavy chain junction region [Macaca mulatta]MOX92298.1 immunoglobulin heavy chain junction region [Macaca mulatta]MOX92713.1 immunoglobulin heavy chain junction region [Macaca mulatta]
CVRDVAGSGLDFW